MSGMQQLMLMEGGEPTFTGTMVIGRAGTAGDYIYGFQESLRGNFGTWTESTDLVGTALGVLSYYQSANATILETALSDPGGFGAVNLVVEVDGVTAVLEYQGGSNQYTKLSGDHLSLASKYTQSVSVKVYSR